MSTVNNHDISTINDKSYSHMSFKNFLRIYIQSRYNIKLEQRTGEWSNIHVTGW